MSRGRATADEFQRTANRLIAIADRTGHEDMTTMILRDAASLLTMAAHEGPRGIADTIDGLKAGGWGWELSVATTGDVTNAVVYERDGDDCRYLHSTQRQVGSALADLLAKARAGLAPAHPWDDLSLEDLLNVAVERRWGPMIGRTLASQWIVSINGRNERAVGTKNRSARLALLDAMKQLERAEAAS